MVTGRAKNEHTDSYLKSTSEKRGKVRSTVTVEGGGGEVPRHSLRILTIGGYRIRNLSNIVEENIGLGLQR